MNDMKPPTARVAESLDDLRVGQVVAFIGHSESRPLNALTAKTLEEGQQWLRKGRGVAVILHDPPPEPVEISEAAIDRLAGALVDYRAKRAFSTEKLERAAANLLDEVRADR